MIRATRVVLVLLVAVTVSPLWADDVEGSNKLLCAALQANECRTDGCSTGPAWEMNIPQFVEIDLDAKVIRATRASGENRQTPIKNIERDNDLIVLQGYEMGRAFSFVISEESGFATVSVAVDDGGVVIFAACTPLGG